MKYPLMRQNIQREDLDSVIELLKEDDPKLTSGPRVREFEEKWSQWLGVKYSIFVNSGSSSNLLAIAWLKEQYPEGGRVIVPPLTWSSDIASVLWMGFKPVFVDIKLESLAINDNLLEKTFDKYNDIRAVFLTHAQGINGLTEKTIKLCKDKKIHLIEDVCESHGVRLFNNKKAGAEGIISCFSFYYAHHMSTIEGGMVCTSDEKIFEYLRMARAHGMLRESESPLIKNEYVKKYPDLNPLFIFPLKGFNFRNNEIGATIGISQLKRLDKMIEKRAENFSYFINGLPNWAFKDFKLAGQSNYAFNLILKKPDQELMSKLEKSLEANQIEFRRGSAGGGNQARQPYIIGQEEFKNFDPSKELPVADHIHFYGMYIGNYPELTKEEIDWLLEVINNV
mgnify:CR=1 FL=1|tara:strand:- start:9860 stop:11044 length:1185 start_codon:yes stop_codon:yes gene_type:complete